jgi:hypothetical protein
MRRDDATEPRMSSKDGKDTRWLEMHVTWLMHERMSFRDAGLGITSCSSSSSTKTRKPYLRSCHRRASVLSEAKQSAVLIYLITTRLSSYIWS